MNVDFRDGFVNIDRANAYARFGDSSLCMVYIGRINDSDFGPDAYRPQYRYIVLQGSNVLDSGEDLHGPLNGEPDMMQAFSTLLSFYGHDADCYAARMAGSALEEWAYNNEDEIYELKDMIDSMN